MADPRIKQKGIDRGMTPEQIRRERDLVDQINKANKEQLTREARLEDRVTALEEIRIIAAGRVSTNGVGGFSSNQTRGCTVTISGTDLLITLDTPRPGSAPFHHQFTGTYQTGSFRSPMISTYNASQIGVTAKNEANVTISAATNSVTMAFDITDWDD
jgi:hypothetical protein